MKITAEQRKRGLLLKMGRRRMIIRNEGKLPARLYRLLPLPYCVARSEDWEQFAVHAIATGFMK